MSWWTSQRLHPKIKSKFIVVFGDCFYIPSVKSVNKPKVEFETKEYRLINHKFNYPGNATWQPVTIKFIDMNGDVDPSRRSEFFDTSSFLWQIMNNTGYRYPYHNISQIRENHYRRENQTSGASSGHWISTKIDDESASSAWRTLTTPEKSSTIANSFGLGLKGDADFKPASTIKQKVSIYQVDPDGFTVELWHLVNPIVKSVGWGELAYDSDEPVEYELQIVYDWAILDRQALGREPEFCADSFTDFMRTVYISNEIDLNEDLENKINKLKELDIKLDEDQERLTGELERLQSLYDEAEAEGDYAAMPGLLGEIKELEDEFKELVDEREEQQELADDVRFEAYETFGGVEEASAVTEMLGDIDAEGDLFNAQNLDRQTENLEEEILQDTELYYQLEKEREEYEEFVEAREKALEEKAQEEERVAQAEQEVEAYAQQLEGAQEAVSQGLERLVDSVPNITSGAEEAVDSAISGLSQYQQEAQQEAQEEAERILRKAYDQNIGSGARESRETQYRDADTPDERLEVIEDYFEAAAVFSEDQTGSELFANTITEEDLEAIESGAFSYKEIIDQIESRQDQNDEEGN